MAIIIFILIAFSSYKLMKDLLENNISATATTRWNRKDFPQELKEVKLSRGESLAVQRNPITACVWQDKKKVHFLTTNCQPTGTDTVQCRKRDGTEETLNAPPCVIAHNKYMGGVAYADQKRNEYRIAIKSRHWYRYLTFFPLEPAMVNTYFLRQL